eukprot:2195058-Prymnesium_polylepis.1
MPTSLARCPRVPLVGTAHPGGWGPHRSQSRAGPRAALCAVAASRHLAGRASNCGGVVTSGHALN